MCEFVLRCWGQAHCVVSERLCLHTCWRLTWKLITKKQRGNNRQERWYTGHLYVNWIALPNFDRTWILSLFSPHRTQSLRHNTYYRILHLTQNRWHPLPPLLPPWRQCPHGEGHPFVWVAANGLEQFWQQQIDQNQKNVLYFGLIIKSICCPSCDS